MIKADSMTGIAETIIEAETIMETDGNSNGVHAIADGTTTTVTRISDGMVIGQAGIRDVLDTIAMIDTKAVNGK
jgi:hypothetical protein